MLTRFVLAVEITALVQIHTCAVKGTTGERVGRGLSLENAVSIVPSAGSGVVMIAKIEDVESGGCSAQN